MKDRRASGLRRRLALYNAIPNFLWSFLNLAPATIFVTKHLEPKWILVYVALSLLPLFIPASLLQQLQVAKTRRTYKKMGVDIINQLAQNGGIINKLIRRRFPAYKSVTPNRASLRRLVGQSYMNEKFHWMMFVFFSLLFVYALYNRLFLWTIILFSSNLFYNIYPILLQQYIRLKLSLYIIAKE